MIAGLVANVANPQAAIGGAALAASVALLLLLGRQQSTLRSF